MSAAARARQPPSPPFIDPPGYAWHRPERTLLYQLVEQHYPAFRELRGAADRALPEFVQQEFEAYLRARCKTGNKVNASRRAPLAHCWRSPPSDPTCGGKCLQLERGGPETPHRSRGFPFLAGSSRASNVWASGPVTTHFSENCGWSGFTRTFHSPGVITVGTRSAGKLFALSHASPNARLTAIRLIQRAGKDLGVRMRWSGISME